VIAGEGNSSELRTGVRPGYRPRVDSTVKARSNTPSPCELTMRLSGEEVRDVVRKLGGIKHLVAYIAPLRCRKLPAVCTQVYPGDMMASLAGT